MRRSHFMTENVNRTTLIYKESCPKNRVRYTPYSNVPTSLKTELWPRMP